MNKKIIISLIIATVLVAGASGFYIGIKKPIPAIQSFITQLNPFKAKVVEAPESLPVTEEEEEVILPQVSSEEPLEELTQPITEVETPSTLPLEPSVTPTTTKILALAEIQTQLNDISKKVEVLKLEVAKYVVEKQLEQLKFTQIQEQIKEAQKRAEVISQQVAQFAAEKAATQQVAGETTETPYTGGPTP